MIYLEMSRDEQHGGGTWGFTNCVWAPTEKKGEGGGWPFWEKVLHVRDGDTILHLRGITPDAYFVGYSTASANGFRTSRRPPDPVAILLSLTWRQLATPVSPIEILTRFVQIELRRRRG